MSYDLILVLSGGVVGFLLGAVSILLLRERPGGGRWVEAASRPQPATKLTDRTQSRSDDTHDHRHLPDQVIQSTTSRTVPLATSPRSAPVAILTAEGGGHEGRTWMLRYAASTTIGRFDDCDIAIDDNGVSRLHAQITHRTDAATAHEFAIFDYSSTNGTMVNGQPINAVASLQDGDTIHIGNTRFLFRRVRQA